MYTQTFRVTSVNPGTGEIIVSRDSADSPFQILFIADERILDALQRNTAHVNFQPVLIRLNIGIMDFIRTGAHPNTIPKPT